MYRKINLYCVVDLVIIDWQYYINRLEWFIGNIEQFYCVVKVVVSEGYIKKFCQWGKRQEELLFVVKENV